MKARPKIDWNSDSSMAEEYERLREWADEAEQEIKELRNQLKLSKSIELEIRETVGRANNRVRQLRATTINEIIDKVESMKGLAGRMAMGEWSSKMIEMLEGLKKEE